MVVRRQLLFFPILSVLIGTTSWAACIQSSNTITCTGGPAASVSMPSDTSGGAIFGKANTYPSSISVTGFSGVVTAVSVSLNGVSSDGGQGNPNASLTQNMGLILVGPTGANLEIMRFVGDGSPNGDELLSNVTINIADSNPTAMPSPTTAFTGTSTTFNFRPGSYSNGSAPAYQSPAPTSPNHSATLGTSTLNGVFNGSTPNGTWSLFLGDRGSSDSVSFGSWTLVLTVEALSGTTTVLGSNLNPSFTSGTSSSVTLTATVTSSATPVASTGTVNFTDSTGGGAPVTIGGCGAVAVDGSGTATCTTTFTTEGNNTLAAVFSGGGSFGPSTSNNVNQFVKRHSTRTPSTNQFCNSGSITIPGVQATQVIYPSVINVGTDTAGFANTVNNLTLTLNGLSATNGIGSVQMMLVSPDGTHALDFLSHGGNTASQSSVNVTFADANPPVPENAALTSTTYEPTSFSNSDTFAPQPPSPAPQFPAIFSLPQPAASATLESTFSGVNTDGDWKLFIYDAGGTGSAASVSGGWCITITPNTGTPTTTTVISSAQQTRTGTSVTFTATVTNTNTSAPIPTGTIKFSENGTTLSGPTAVNGSGQAAFTTSSLTEGEHTILASYHDGSAINNDSFGSVVERIDNNPTSSFTNSTATYCNTGAITIPAGATLPNNIGPAGPNPSNVFVNDLPGTINTVTLTLKGAHHPFPTELNSLLVGPAAINTDTLDFFSDTGGVNPFGPIDVIFGDSGAQVSATSPPAASPTVNHPTSRSSTQTYAASAFYTLPAIQFAAPTGSAAFAMYGNANGNGTWSLYFDQTAHANGGGIDNGWCMNFTENPPVLSGAKSDGGVHFVQGQPGQYTITVHNAGPGSAGGATAPVVVTDTLAADLTPVSGSGTNWACNTVSQTITCSNTSFVGAGNDFPVLTINVNASNTAGASVMNTASVGGSLNTTPVSTNTTTTTIDPAPVLSVTKTHSGTFTQGQTGEWDITVSNTKAGSKTAGTTTVVDTLPSGYTLNSFASTGNVWTCGSVGTTVTCTSTSVVSGGASFNTLQLFVNIPANSAVSVTNNVGTFGGGDVNHVSSGTAATASDTVTVVQVPASITANAGTTPQSALIGSAFANPLAVTVKDAGGVVINGLSVTFTAPAQTGPSGTFANSTGTTSANTGANGVATATTFTANSNAGGPYSVQAAAGSVTTNFSLTNTAPSNSAVLSSQLTGKAGPANARVWSFSVFNTGIGPATSASVSSFTLTQVAGTACTPVINTTIPIALGTIVAGGSAPFSVTIDFSGCALASRFTLNFGLSANGGANTATVTKFNQFQ